MTEDPFDPYWQWLAIPPAEQPPDHYRLLGLRPFESDRQIIARAVRLRIDHVRAFDDGRRHDAVERLLKHLSAAADTLRNPTLKAQYDDMLRRKQSIHASAFHSIIIEENQKPADRRPLSVPLLVSGVAIGMLITLGAATWLSPGKEPGIEQTAGNSDQGQGALRSESDLDRAARPSGTSGADKHPARGSSSESPRRGATWRPRGPETLADLMGEPDDAATDTSTVTGKLAGARRAMWSRDLAEARRQVAEATAVARTPTERSEVRRVNRLLESLEAFWRAVRQALAQLEGGEELRAEDEMIMVVEAGGGDLTVRRVGRNVTYSTEDLPRELAVALAQRNLPKGQPATHLCIGSFLAIDRRGDRHEAYVWWERAGAEGKALLAELTLAPAPRAGEPDQPGHAPALPPDGRGPLPGADQTAEPQAIERMPVPEADAIARAEQEIRGLFKDDFQKAHTLEDKKALADKLSGVAGQVDDDPPARYALLLIGRDLAVEAGEPDAFCRIIDEMDRHYTIDALAMKAEAVTSVWQSGRSRSDRKALTDRSVQLLDAAIQAEHFVAAERFIRVAQSGARATNDHRLRRQLEERSRQIKASLQGGQ